VKTVQAAPSSHASHRLRGVPPEGTHCICTAYLWRRIIDSSVSDPLLSAVEKKCEKVKRAKILIT